MRGDSKSSELDKILFTNNILDDTTVKRIENYTY